MRSIAEWQSTHYLKPNMLKIGDQIVVSGNLTRSNTIGLIILKRLSDDFSRADSNAVSSAPCDDVMFVSSTAR